MKVLKVQQALLEQHLWLLLLLDQNTTLNLSNNVHIKHNNDDNLNDDSDNNKNIGKKKWKDNSQLSQFSLEAEPIIEINPNLCARRPATTIIDCAKKAPVGAARSAIELPCRTKLRKNYYNLRYNSCICSSNEYTTFCHPIRLPMPMPVPVPVPLQSNLLIAPRRLRRTCTIFNPFSIAFLLLIVLSGDLWPHTKSVLTGLHISVGVYYVSCATWPRPSTPLLAPTASSGLPASSLRPLLMPHLRHHFSNRLKMWQKYLKHRDNNGSKIVNHHPHSLPYSSSLSVFPFSSSYSLLQSSTLSKSNLYPHKNKYFFTNINNDNTDNGIRNDSLSFSSLTDDAADKTADTSDTRIVLINTISSKNVFVKLNSSGDMFLKSSLPSPLSTEAAVPVAAAAAMTTPPQFLKRSSRNLKQFRVFSPGSFSPPFSTNSNNVVVVGSDSSTTGTSSDNNDNQKEIMKSILSKISKSSAMKKTRTSTTTTATVMTKAKATSKAASTGPLFSPCSHIGDEINEISARAFIADIVFEGKVRSRSTEKDASGKYGVTFVVQRVYKDEMPATAAAATATLTAASPLASAFKIGASATPPAATVIEVGVGSGTGAGTSTNTGTTSLQNTLWPKQQVRLFFMEKSSTTNFTKPMAHCFQRYHFTKKQAELTKANIKRGRRYIVFINRIAPHNYTVVGEPVPSTKRNLRAVNEVLCRACVRQIGVWGLKNESVNAGEQLRLVCRMRGTPLPALQWFKDGAPIIVTSRLRIQYKKKRSLLVIPKVRNSDSGKYECRGVGVQSSTPVSSSSIVTINAKIDNITALWPLVGKSCPMYLVYCLNGGSCTYYETIGEFTCQCADGFNGGRCENKDVVNSNSTYEPITCYDGVTPSYPCVTVHKPVDYSYYPP